MNVSDDTLPAPGAPAAPLAPLTPTTAAAGAAKAAPTTWSGKRRALVASLAVAGVTAAALAALLALARAGDRPLAAVALPALAALPSETAKGSTPQELRRLEKRLAAVGPRGAYIVIDTVYNRLQLWKRDKLVIEAPCSTGTGAVLADPSTGRRWVFDTPQGAHRVQIKLRDPVWRKPDWAFIEEGKPLPTDPQERFDFEALGDYGLYFGDGYLIHGTLYQRLLGRSVTHGCIRLGDDDLAAVFRASPVGTPIYIF